MNNYEKLLDIAENEHLIVKEKDLQSSDGRIKGNHIAIRKTINTTVNKSCVLAEEIGHHYTTTGNIIDIQDIQNIKQERKARIWAYNKLIGLQGIVNAYKQRCSNRHETAEFLNVTEDFLAEALKYYTEKYGTHTVYNQYIIYFTPSIAVLELFE